MKNYLKIIVCSLAIIILCACSRAEMPENATNNTTSNIQESTSAESGTTETATMPPAQPVISVLDMSKSKIVWGPGNIKNHEQPTDPVSLQKQFSSLGAKWLLDSEKEICLTFDEGYENGLTPSILDVLKEKNVKAIFFVTYDFARDNNALIQRMIDEGHIVANHSYHHYSMDEIDVETAKEEVQFLHDYIKDNFNYTMSYFRFPKGEFSEQSLGIVSELGYKSIFWSFAYADWDVDNQPNESDALKLICESTHAGEIMLLHAVSKTNVAVLPKVIDDIRQQGYTFTVDI